MDKSITVLVRRKVLHPLYKKFVTQTKKFIAHDEDNTAKLGENVLIRECRPISKRKSWQLIAEGERNKSTNTTGDSA